VAAAPVVDVAAGEASGDDPEPQAASAARARIGATRRITSTNLVVARGGRLAVRQRFVIVHLRYPAEP
jgi:hypothetical protein